MRSGQLRQKGTADGTEESSVPAERGPDAAQEQREGVPGPKNGGAAGGGTHLFDPVVEVVGSTRPSQ